MDVNEYFEIIRPVGDFPYSDFAIGRNKETNQICVIFSYDQGYDYPSWPLDDLLDIDPEEIMRRIENNIIEMITKTRPYSNNFGNIFEENKQ